MLRLLISLLFLTCLEASAQSGSIGSWREHLPYRQGAYVATAAQRIFCATNQGLFAYGKDDQSLQRLSKLNGLNDFGISHISYSSDYKRLIIAYENANIDLLDDNNKVTNLNDISRKNIPGNKRINHITVAGRYVYFACGFGIVVLDLQRMEIKETYYIGANGAAVNVMDVALSDTKIFAATETGVFSADLNNPNLADYNNWTQILIDATANTYNRATVFNNNLLVNVHTSAGDSILKWNNGWLAADSTLPKSGTNYALKTVGSELLIINADSVITYDNSFQVLSVINGNNIPGMLPNDVLKDGQGYWMADRANGLIEYNGNAYTKYFPIGPNSEAVAAMQVVDGRLWVIHGPKNRGWNNSYKYEGFSYYEEGKWVSYDLNYTHTPLFSQYNFFDNMSVAVDPSDKDHLFVGSGGAGMIEFKDGTAMGHYNTLNSTLKEQVGNPGQVKVHGIALDDDANLWVTNAGVNTVLNLRKPNGQWRSFNVPGAVNSGAKTGDIVIDENGAKWVAVFENVGLSDGILYYDDSGTPDNVSDDQYSLISISSHRVRSLAVDMDGTIWAGLDAGIYVFYPPSLEPQKIIIKQEGSYQYLLETESVTAIYVDGANRKWVGTENAGVFLFSADGQEQLQHFTTSNSPLFSNNIYAITIDGKTGQVYIGTDKGLISYQSDAVEGKESCTDVEVYPNPVSSGYAGPIAIKGVPENGTVKITDASGNLVFETQALGGQAVWYGNNLKGERASTGVYLVYAMNQEGEETCNAKLLFTR